MPISSKVSSAFTLIEVILVVAVMALITAILPRLAITDPKNAWPSITDEINDIAFLARQEAIMHREFHRLLWRRIDGNDELTIERYGADPEDEKKQTYLPLKPGIPGTYKLPKGVSVTKVSIDGVDSWLGDRKGVGLAVMPDGVIQGASVTLQRTKGDYTDAVIFTMQSFLGTWERGEAKEVRL